MSLTAWLSRLWPLTPYRGDRTWQWFPRRWEDITRADGRPYLRRLVLFSCPAFGLYLHQFMGSDDPCPHDHPWPYSAIVLAGGYWEETWLSGDYPDPPDSRVWQGAGSFHSYGARHTHRLDVPAGGAWTLVARGQKCRGWGFWTKFGWLPWRRYHHAEHCGP